MSERRACEVVGIWRSSHRYRSHRKDDRALRMRIGSARSRRPGFGTDIVGFRSCLGARAGASITSGHIGSIARRGSTCVGSVLAGMSRAADG